MDLMQATDAIEWVESRHLDQLNRAESDQIMCRWTKSVRSSTPESEAPSIRLVVIAVLLMTVVLLASVAV